MLAVSVSAVVAVATAVNLVLLLAVVRRLRLLEARGPQPFVPSALPAAGTVVGSFRAADTSGAEMTEADLAGGPRLVAFVMTGCDPCHGVLTSLRTDTRFDPARTLILVAGEAGSARAREVLELADGLGRVAMVEHGGPVTVAFGRVDGFPALLSVRDGVVVSSGRQLDDVAPAGSLSPVG
jgi:hypothetical protein